MTHPAWARLDQVSDMETSNFGSGGRLRNSLACPSRAGPIAFVPPHARRSSDALTAKILPIGQKQAGAASSPRGGRRHPGFSQAGFTDRSVNRHRAFAEHSVSNLARHSWARIHALA